MSTALAFDDARAGQVEAMYATPDVAATRIAVFRAADPRRGEAAIDLGCGPGYLLRDLALAVGERGSAHGIDISAPMLHLAGRRCAGLEHVSLHAADASNLPFADASIDLVCALQVLAYIPEVDRALAELRRVLRPGGRLVILDTDFAGVVWESRDRRRMRAVLDAYEGHVAWPDLPRLLPARLQAAGFRLGPCEAVPFVTTRYHANTYVFGIARFIHRFVTEQGRVAPAVADAWLAEFDALEAERAFFFALNRFLFVASRI